MFVLDGGKRFVIIALVDLAKAVQAGTASAAYLAEQAAKSKAITGHDILEQMRRVA